MVKQSITAFVVGLLFGFGLCLSRMVDPAVVVGFADITGTWDPRLLFVMAGALAVAMISFPLIMKYCRQPVCDARFYVPENRAIDKRLIIGAVIFGVGWGLGGVCPGPAITALAFGLRDAWVFLAAMTCGMWLYKLASRQSS